jgi:ATP-dependent Clp protease ATP-binding subunit ClpA
MYERFTDASREVMRLAAEEAARWNLEYIGTEHVLIALALSNSHSAGAILHQCGINGRHSIGTEHLLHGLLCDEESVGCYILAHEDCGLAKVRELFEQARAESTGQQ